MLAYYFLASLGLCFILKYATILNHLRNLLTSNYNFFKDLFHCSMCLGFWCGAVFVPILWTFENLEEISLLYPFGSSAFCWSMDILLDALVAITHISREEQKDVIILETAKEEHKEVGKMLL